MMLPPDLRSEIRWLSSGFLLTFHSGFGQTYFIAVFAGHLMTDLALSDGAFGGLYTIGTLCSAALLALTGRFADLVPIRWLGAGVLGGLALTSVAMAAVSSAWMLALVFFGLRFFGQGMLTHTAMTAMGRWFNRKRGRAVAIAGLGLPASEGLLPPIAVALAAVIGWRETWIAGAVLLLLAAPTLIGLLKHERHPTLGPGSAADPESVDDRRQWTRSEVLREPTFYALLPGMLATPFVFTAVFFNQVTVAAAKGWTLALFAAAFPLLAVAHVGALLAAGWIIDRFAARQVLSAQLLLLGGGTLLLAMAERPELLFVAMAIFGLTLGVSAATAGTLWAELYGVEHLGSIRSVATALTVLATAAAPGIVGVLLDMDVAIELLLIAMAVYAFTVAAWMAMLQPRLARVAAGC